MPAKEELTQVEKDKLHFGFDFDFRQIARRPAESFTPGELALFSLVRSSLMRSAL